MKLAKKFLLLPLLATFVVPFSLRNESIKVDAYTEDDFYIGSSVGNNPWTINEDDTFVNKNNIWDSNFLIFKELDTTPNVENRLEYTITTSFQGPDIASIGEDQWRGIVIYYVDSQNFLEAVCKWSKSDRSHELQELMLHGKINGEFYETGSVDNWTSTEWHDIWTDGCAIASDETVTLTASIYPKDPTHDEVSLSATGSSGGVASGKQTIRSLVSYASNYPENGPDVGLYSHLGDNKTGSVTFSSFEFRNDSNIGKTPYIEEFGTRTTCGYKNESVKLPTFTATNGKFDILSCDVEVLDPNGLPVEIKKNAFMPELTGLYTVNATCVDERYDEVAEPISYQIKIYEKVEISITQSFANPTYGVTNNKIHLPIYSTNVDTEFVAKVRDENNEEIEVYEGNYFVPTHNGVYYVTISSTNEFFGIKDINFHIDVYEYDPIENPNNANIALMVIVSIVLFLVVAGGSILIFVLLRRRDIND